MRKQEKDLGVLDEVIDVAVRSWMLEQLIDVERHQPEMVDRIVKETWPSVPTF